MRPLFMLLVAATALAQSSPQIRVSLTPEALRGVSAVSRQIAWASGTHGTYLRTTDGRIWIPEQVPGAESLDFRAVVAFSADEAFLMSAGPGDQSRIYHTADRGRHWQLQFTNTNPKGFFDSMVFWDATHGIVLGDPIPDQTGKETSKDSGQLKFELLITTDGESWNHIPPSQLPPALEGEGAFAASNTCLAILPTLARINSSVILSGDTRPVKRDACRSRRTPCTSSSAGTSQGIPTTDALSVTPHLVPASWQSAAALRTPGERQLAPDSNIWFATGGKAARVFHSPDRGQTWQVFNTPITHGPDSAGIFSIAFRDPIHGVVAGGDYKHPDQDGPNLALTNDGGKTWTLSKITPQSYYSAAAYDRKQKDPKAKDLDDNQANIRLFLVGPKFVYDFRPPKNPVRLSPTKKSSPQFNAATPYPEGGVLVVGTKGTIATIP
jgi:photosystem II stability/assembly factor-like uncharacterized protein